MWLGHILKWSQDYMPKFDFNLFLACLDFAKEQQYEECFQKVGKNLVSKVIRHITRGKIPTEEGFSYLDTLLPRINDFAYFANFTQQSADRTSRHKERFFAILEYMFKYTLQHHSE
jgi:hypothetical protein